MKILILTYRMAMGFGVDVVVGETARRLKKRGSQITIGVIDQEPDVYSDLNIRKLDQSNPVSKSFLIANDPDLIVIHTFPFFEQVRYLKEFAPVIFWEHGDPSPELQDETSRLFLQNEKNNKQRYGYASANGIIAISEFIASEVGNFNHEVLFNGANHLSVFRKSEMKKPVSSKLTVGVLNRIGPGENKYKGLEYFQDLVNEFQEDSNIEFYFAGKGKEEDAKSLFESGIKVKLNLSENEKKDYLQSLDVFISFSLWEGFNLPIVEASALGTLSIAFDTGAHPEVTPFIFRNTYEMGIFLKCLAQNSELLKEYSELGQQFVLEKFDWEATSEKAFQFLRMIYIRDTNKKSLSMKKRINILFHLFLYLIFRFKSILFGVFYFIKSHGIINFIRLINRRLLRLL